MSYSPISIQELPEITADQIDQSSALIMLSEINTSDVLSTYTVGYVDFITNIISLINRTGIINVGYNVFLTSNTETINITILSENVYFFTFHNTGQGNLTLNFDASTILLDSIKLNLVFIANTFSTNVVLQLNGITHQTLQIISNKTSIALGIVNSSQLTVIYQSSSTTFANLLDVQITSPLNKQIITYNSTLQKYVNTNPLLSNLFDVSISGLEDGDLLSYVSSENRWRNDYIGNINRRNSLENRVRFVDLADVVINPALNVLVPSGSPLMRLNDEIHEISYTWDYLFNNTGSNPDPVITLSLPQLSSNNAPFVNIYCNPENPFESLTFAIDHSTFAINTHITLFIRIPQNTLLPSSILIQGQQSYIVYPQQTLIIELLINNNGYINSPIPPLDSGTNLYNRISFLNLRYIPDVTNFSPPGSLTFDNLSNFTNFYVNYINSNFHINNISAFFTENIRNSSNSVRYFAYFDPFNTDQYNIFGLEDNFISFFPNTSSNNTFTNNNIWSVIYNKNTALETAIITQLPAGGTSYLPLFCCITPKNNLTNDVLQNSIAGKISSLCDGTINTSGDFKDSVEYFHMFLVNKAGEYFFARFENNIFTINLLSNLPNRAFTVIQNNGLTVNQTREYPFLWKINSSTLNARIYTDTNLYISVPKLIYPPVFPQGYFIIDNTGPILNNLIFISYASAGITYNGSVAAFPEKIFATNDSAFYGGNLQLVEKMNNNAP